LYSKEIQTDFVEEKVVQVPIQVVSEIIEPVEQKQEPQKELSEQELFELMISDDFVDFFEKSAKVMERALNEDYDFLKDYNADSQMYFIIIRQEKSKDVIRLYRSFSHERWTKNRNVTDIQWSMRFSELLLGSYNKNTCNINESDGLVLVWNVHLIERPEFVLHSQSDVMAARFSPFNPSIIVGGTFSGQICVWDTRAKPTPVLTTSLSSPGHSHPIYSLSVVGTQNAHNLISASTDGTVCSWQLDMLAQPQDLIELTLANEHNKTDEVAVTCMDFQPQETTTFWIGSEQGTVYQANRFDRAGRFILLM
jgi:dynein intermediate chain